MSWMHANASIRSYVGAVRASVASPPRRKRDQQSEVAARPDRLLWLTRARRADHQPPGHGNSSADIDVACRARAASGAAACVAHSGGRHTAHAADRRGAAQIRPGWPVVRGFSRPSHTLTPTGAHPTCPQGAKGNSVTDRRHFFPLERRCICPRPRGLRPRRHGCAEVDCFSVRRDLAPPWNRRYRGLDCIPGLFGWRFDRRHLAPHVWIETPGGRRSTVDMFERRVRASGMARQKGMDRSERIHRP